MSCHTSVLLVWFVYLVGPSVVGELVGSRFDNLKMREDKKRTEGVKNYHGESLPSAT